MPKHYGPEYRDRFPHTAATGTVLVLLGKGDTADAPGYPGKVIVGPATVVYRLHPNGTTTYARNGGSETTEETP